MISHSAFFALGFLACYIAFSIAGRIWLKRQFRRKGSTASRPGQNSKSDVSEQVIHVLRR